MASLNMLVSPAISKVNSRTRLQPSFSNINSRRGVQPSFATAAKGSAGGKEEKSLLDFVLGALQKEDQLLEVDPILNKVEGKKGTTGGKKGAVAPPKKEEGGGGFGGFGSLFAKK